MLRRFSGLSCGKCCFYSLIFAFIISLGCINTANAYVCFLPDSSDCAQGDTEGFWPCVGSDCEGGENGKCDASYNSRMSTNECGAACTRCSDSTSPYNTFYKCPENTCNCNDYTSDDPTNECGEHCKVCRIAGDKNYGKYKCPAVPASGCPNPCNDCTLTEAQAQAKMASDPCMECEQCTNLNCSDDQRAKWHCSENRVCKQCKDGGYNKTKNSSEYITSQQTCSRMQCEECPYNNGGDAWYKCSECSGEYTQNSNNLTSQQIANHCDANQTCGCFMGCDSCFGYEYTMQDCINAGYNSAKNECNGKRGTVYEKCCNTCNGYIYSTDLSKTSEGWSCTECPNSCDGGSKFSCGCKTGYHTEGGNCVLNQCTTGVAENTCNTANGYTFTPNGTPFTNTNGKTIRCGECKKDEPENTSCPKCFNSYDGGCYRLVMGNHEVGGSDRILYYSFDLWIESATPVNQKKDFDVNYLVEKDDIGGDRLVLDSGTKSFTINTNNSKSDNWETGYDQDDTGQVTYKVKAPWEDRLIDVVADVFGRYCEREFKCEDFGMVNEIPEQNCANGTKDIYVELPIPNTGGKKAYELYGVHCYSKVANVPCPECVDKRGPTGCNNSGYRYEYTYSEVRNCYEKKQITCSCKDVNYPNDCNVSPYLYFNGEPYDEGGRCIYYENGQYLGNNGRGVYRYCKPLEYVGKVCGATYVDIPCYECINNTCYGSTHNVSYPSYLRLQH